VNVEASARRVQTRLIELGDRYCIRQLRVAPRSGTAPHWHEHCAAYWVVVKGTAKVTRGGYVLELSENESIFIPRGMRHRLENPLDGPLDLIEVQLEDRAGAHGPPPRDALESA
jgi:mannose-6-phosphate isomerase-like protein (cupin superfamily)